MIKYLLWDIDNTLLSFDLAEKSAMTKGFEKFGLSIEDDNAIPTYRQINDKYWEMLENKEMTRAEILTGRFGEFFDLYNLTYDDKLLNDFNIYYQTEIGNTIFFNPNAEQVLENLAKNYKQYAITNGTKIAQVAKLKNSGLDKIFDGVFISEDVGYDKPDPKFFETIFDEVGSRDMSEYIIIGDSLTSDIRGANNVGITNIWYNPNEKENNLGIKIDYEIKDLGQIPGILDKLSE